MRDFSFDRRFFARRAMLAASRVRITERRCAQSLSHHFFTKGRLPFAGGHCVRRRWPSPRRAAHFRVARRSPLCRRRCARGFALFRDVLLLCYSVDDVISTLHTCTRVHIYYLSLAQSAATTAVKLNAALPPRPQDVSLALAITLHLQLRPSILISLCDSNKF